MSDEGRPTAHAPTRAELPVAGSARRRQQRCGRRARRTDGDAGVDVAAPRRAPRRRAASMPAPWAMACRVRHSTSPIGRARAGCGSAPSVRGPEAFAAREIGGDEIEAVVARQCEAHPETCRSAGRRAAIAARCRRATARRRRGAPGRACWSAARGARLSVKPNQVPPARRSRPPRISAPPSPGDHHASGCVGRSKNSSRLAATTSGKRRLAIDRDGYQAHGVERLDMARAATMRRRDRCRAVALDLVQQRIVDAVGLRSRSPSGVRVPSALWRSKRGLQTADGVRCSVLLHRGDRRRAAQQSAGATR